MNSGVVVFCFPSSFVVFLQFFLCSAILPVRFIIKWKGGVAVYRIVSPINNNIALVKDESQRELIVTGKGIVFQKKKGDIIASSLVDKVFRLNTEESKENFLALLKDVPLDFITVTYDVIDTLTLKYNYPVQDYLYVTLTDHIYCTYQSIQTGNYKAVSYQMFQESIQLNTKLVLRLCPFSNRNYSIVFQMKNLEGLLFTL